MERMLGRRLYALVVLDVSLQLLVANHSLSEETELVTSLLFLVVHHLVGKVCFNRMSVLLVVLALTVSQNLVGWGDMCDLTMVTIVISGGRLRLIFIDVRIVVLVNELIFHWFKQAS